VTNNSPNAQKPQYGVIQQTGDEGGAPALHSRRPARPLPIPRATGNIHTLPFRAPTPALSPAPLLRSAGRRGRLFRSPLRARIISIPDRRPFPLTFRVSCSCRRAATETMEIPGVAIFVIVCTNI
jgi:hypothetical protein